MRSLAFVAMVFTFTLGCGGASIPDDDFLPQAADESAKTDGKGMPFGTYEAVNADAGDITLFVLNTDYEYYQESNCKKKECKGLRGRYQFTQGGSTKYVTFFYEDSDYAEVQDRYAYVAKSTEIKLRKINTTKWQKFVRPAAAWCEDAYDCSIQGLTHPMCLGDWSCAEAKCTWECGNTVCQQRGGTCVDMGQPGACADGVVGDWDQYACSDDPQGPGCCLPAGATNCVKEGGTCKPDSQCGEEFTRSTVADYGCGQQVCCWDN